MNDSITSVMIARPRSRILGLSLAALLMVAVLLGFVFTGGAQAAVSYGEQELAFITLLNNYRASNGLQPLLLSDMIAEACDRHNSDMGKYKFFSHYSVASDWFAKDAAPWDRMAKSGYTFSTNKGENIAAGQSTATEVFNAWKASSGHNANMLNSTYKVIGVSLVIVPGAPYTYYWTTDFGGYVDSTAHAPNQSAQPGATCYQQTDSRLTYSNTWATFTTSGASGGSYKRAANDGSSVTVCFNGTNLTWIATKGTTLGKALVSLDGGAPVSVNLAASTVAYQQKVWNSGTLPAGQHTVKIWRDPTNVVGKYISADAFEVVGSLTQAPITAPTSTVYQQTDSRLDYAGTWYTFSTSGASGGSYKRANTSTGSVTVTFTGTNLTWIATKGTTLGKALVSLDGGAPVSVNLAASTVAYQQRVWNTGTLASGQHTVKIWWDPTNIAGKYISIDAFDVTGTLN
jgi:hypothetical protein